MLLLILRIAPALHNVTTNPFEDMLRTRADALIFAIVVMVAGGLREEVQRGFIAHRFDQYLGGARGGSPSTACSSVAGHLDQGYRRDHRHWSSGDSSGACSTFRDAASSPPLVSHATFNLAQLLKYLAFAAK